MHGNYYVISYPLNGTWFWDFVAFRYLSELHRVMHFPTVGWTGEKKEKQGNVCRHHINRWRQKRTCLVTLLWSFHWQLKLLDKGIELASFGKLRTAENSWGIQNVFRKLFETWNNSLNPWKTDRVMGDVSTNWNDRISVKFGASRPIKWDARLQIVFILACK